MNKHFSKEDIQKVKSVMKRCSASFIFKSWKLRQNEIPLHTYLLGWLKSKAYQYKCWQECRTARIFHLLLVEMQNGTATLEDNLPVS